MSCLIDAKACFIDTEVVCLWCEDKGLFCIYLIMIRRNRIINLVRFFCNLCFELAFISETKKQLYEKESNFRL